MFSESTEQLRKPWVMPVIIMPLFLGQTPPVREDSRERSRVCVCAFMRTCVCKRNLSFFPFEINLPREVARLPYVSKQKVLIEIQISGVGAGTPPTGD